MGAPDLSIPCYCLQLNSQIRNCQGKWFICYRDFWHSLVELLSTVSSLPLDITLGRDSSPLTDELSLISCHYTSSLHKGNKAENCTLTHSKAVGAQLSWLISHIISKLLPECSWAGRWLIGQDESWERSCIQWLYTFSCSWWFRRGTQTLVSDWAGWWVPTMNQALFQALQLMIMIWNL